MSTEKLTPAEKSLVERVLAQFPDLSWREAVEYLRESGM